MFYLPISSTFCQSNKAKKLIEYSRTNLSVSNHIVKVSKSNLNLQDSGVVREFSIQLFLADFPGSYLQADSPKRDFFFYINSAPNWLCDMMKTILDFMNNELDKLSYVKCEKITVRYMNYDDISFIIGKVERMVIFPFLWYIHTHLHTCTRKINIYAFFIIWWRYIYWIWWNEYDKCVRYLWILINFQSHDIRKSNVRKILFLLLESERKIGWKIWLIKF